MDRMLAVFTNQTLIASCSLFCEGPVLAAVQLQNVFPDDSKTYVDMPAKQDPDVILAAFNQLSAAEKKDTAALQDFVAQYFDKEGSDLLPANATDFSTEPAFLQRIEPGPPRTWAAAVHGLWPTLLRSVSPDVLQHPQRHSLLHRQSNVVVPGGRFRESYYWDSFWIVKGLIVGDMLDTAQGVVQNLLDDVTAFGHVPNGGRVYYTLRSQPPLLSDMVMAVLDAMAGSSSSSSSGSSSSGTAGGRSLQQQQTFLQGALASLKQEHAFWMSQRAVTVKGHKLNRYWCSTSDARPRPESYREDLETAGADRDIMAEITAVAESGWDFSSRWWVAPDSSSSSSSATELQEQQQKKKQQPLSLKDTAIRRIVPADLNTYMYRFEMNLAELSRRVGAAADAKLFTAAAAARAAAMNELMYDSDATMWRDLILPESCSRPVTCSTEEYEQSQQVTAACYIPLWGGEAFRSRATGSSSSSSSANSSSSSSSSKSTEAANAKSSSSSSNSSDGDSSSLIASLQESQLVGPGGIMTTAFNSGEQWDRPNSWPPLQWMIVEGLRACSTSETTAYSQELAMRWLQGVHRAYQQDGYMHEKYNALTPGVYGTGGEYVAQTGFGWTNGVALDWIDRYYRH